MKNILIAENHPLLVIGMEKILFDLYPFANVQIAADFNKVLKLLDHETFDLLIMEINLPHGNNFEMLAAIRMKQPEIFILVCSAYEEHLYALPYIRAGVNGFISKKALTGEFKQAVESVWGGKIYASADVLSQIFGILSNNNNLKLRYMLSGKETNIARMLVKGLTTKDISLKINLSSSAVSNYKRQIFEKLGVKNIIELSTHLELEGE